MRAPRPSSPGRASARLTQSGKIGGHVAQQQSVQILQERLEYEQKLVQLVDRIHSAKGIDNIFIELQGEILELLDAERMTIYAVDTAKKELYSKFLALDTVKEIRLPVSEKSIAGYVAASGRIVNVADAYDKAELTKISPTLSFDGSWDKKTGFRTQQILGMPILHDGKPIGVIQLLNKKRGPRFTKEDETGASRIAKTLGIAFNNQTQLSQSQERAQSQAKRKTKFDYLVAQQRVTAQELSSAVAEARGRQTDVESILIEQYKVPKNEVGIALSQFYECPFVEYDDKIIPPPDLIKGLRIEYLRRKLLATAQARGPQHRRAHRQPSRSAANRQRQPGAEEPEDQVGGRAPEGHPVVLGTGGRRRYRQGCDRHDPRRPARRGRRRHTGHQRGGARRKRQRGHPPGEPDHRRRVQVARVRHPHRALRHPEGHGHPLSHRRKLRRVPEDPGRLPSGDRGAHQDHGPAGHRGATQAAGRENQVQGGRPRDRAARGHDPDRQPERGRGHARPVLERADPPRQARHDAAQRA